MVEINFNDYIYVRLTQHGRTIHYENWEASPASTFGLPYNAPVEDAEGWSRWQFWDLMQQFGAHMGMGMPNPFECVIRIEDEAQERLWVERANAEFEQRRREIHERAGVGRTSGKIV